LKEESIKRKQKAKTWVSVLGVECHLQ
jgi:hypothetical protein